VAPSGASSAITSGVDAIWFSSRFRRATTGAGVPAGANTVTQMSAAKPGTALATVGSCGNTGLGCADVTASARTLPDLICGAMEV
jgi:hypothetical protein